MPDIRTVDGATPLFVAVEQNRLAAAQALLDAGCQAQHPGTGGRHPVVGRGVQRQPASWWTCCSSTAPITTVGDLSGKVPIVYAAARGFTPVVLAPARDGRRHRHRLRQRI